MYLFYSYIKFIQMLNLFIYVVLVLSSLLSGHIDWLNLITKNSPFFFPINARYRRPGVSEAKNFVVGLHWGPKVWSRYLVLTSHWSTTLSPKINHGELLFLLTLNCSITKDLFIYNKFRLWRRSISTMFMYISVFIEYSQKYLQMIHQY